MRTFKTGMMMIAVLLFAGTAFAQSLEDGKKFMYYERYESAKGAFEKLLAANPKNEQAAYYLGQADIGLENIAAAKTVYQNFLAANPNSPLVLAGMGHVELLEGKTQDARSRFETAISLSKGKSIEVLNAVGYANGNFDVKSGDAAYAVEKLKQATELKGFKDPEVLVNLGDAYRKFADGGNAVQSYDKALAIDPNYARAIYRKGRVYQTQGVSQEPLYLGLYNEAIAKDPRYAPVYMTLYSYYYDTNVGKSAEYLDKWLSNSDDDPKACYYRAAMKYAQGLFAEVISKADECAAAEGANPYAKLFGLKAFAYNRLSDASFKIKDSAKAQEYLVKAKDNFDEYLKRQDPEKVGAGDYSGYASILVKFPGNEDKVVDLVNKAVALDTLEENKVIYLKNIGSALANQKKFEKAASIYTKVVNIRTPKNTYSNLDLYNVGYNYYLNNQYDSTIKYFTMYADKYPNDIFGYYMVANANAVIDSNSVAGLAAPFYQKVIEIGESDLTAANVKPRLITAYRYFMGYEYNVKKNKEEALKYADKAVALAPEDEGLKSNRDFIANNTPK